MKRLILFFITFSFISSSIAQETSCQWNLNKDSVKVTWTGYKFTEKTAVSGGFNKIKTVASSSSFPSFDDMLKSHSVSIETASFESENPARNKNIINNLFKKIAGGDLIQGQIQELDKQSAKVNFKWGEKNFTQVFKLVSTDSNFTLDADLDLEQIGFSSAYAALKKACQAFHKGSDGKTVSWPTFHIQIVGNFEKKCASSK